MSKRPAGHRPAASMAPPSRRPNPVMVALAFVELAALPIIAPVVAGHTGARGAAMSKQVVPPPAGDKSRPTAPPPPPTWRNWLWPIMIFAIFALWLFLPTRSASTNLSYSQFLSDVSAHQVKTVQLAGTSGGTSTGT